MKLRDRIEQKSEIARQTLASIASTAPQPGSWFEGKDTGTSGLAQTLVTTAIKLDTEIESWLARGIYWVAPLIGLAISGYWIWFLPRNNYSRDSLMAGSLVIAATLLMYSAGWGWRWLWTGRVDHLLAAKKYTPPGRLDEARKNVSSFISILNF